MRHLLNGMKNGYNLGKFDHDRALFSRALEIKVYFREIIPFFGRKIQVGEI
jgi:hypothetical protein